TFFGTFFPSPPQILTHKLGDALTTRLNAAHGTAGSESDDPCRIWLGGLPSRTTEFAVIQLARQFGQLTDFRFPVHRAGENQGSTVGYCFISYANPTAAQKALSALDGLNFHGRRLIVRRAHLTRDELDSVQQSEVEAARLRIAEQAKLCEAKLAARLAADPATANEPTSTMVPSIVPKSDQSDPLQLPSSMLETDLTTRSNPTIPDLYGRLGRVDWNRTQSSTVSSGLGAKRSPGIVQGHKRPMETKQAIRRIEIALQKLEQTPVGGTELLQPLSTVSRSAVPPGILAHPTNVGVSGRDSRNTSSRGFSGSRGYPRRPDRNMRPRLSRL
ncbi:putative RNA-binding protein 18, partial [Fasciola gigantica]